MTTKKTSLESAFNDWRNAFNTGNLNEAYGVMNEDMVIFDEDIPWRFSKTDFVEHIQFHGPNWESFEWVARELQFEVRGETRIISGYATLPGKPRDSGFRQGSPSTRAKDRRLRTERSRAPAAPAGACDRG